MIAIVPKIKIDPCSGGIHNDLLEKEMETKNPAKIGPIPFVTLVPMSRIPFILARCCFGTDRLVAIARLVKQAHTMILLIPITALRNSKMLHFDEPSRNIHTEMGTSASGTKPNAHPRVVDW